MEMDDPTPQDNRQQEMLSAPSGHARMLCSVSAYYVSNGLSGTSLVRTDLAPYCPPERTGLRGPAVLFSELATKPLLSPLGDWTLWRSSRCRLATFGRTFCVAASDVLCCGGLPYPQELSCIRDSPTTGLLSGSPLPFLVAAAFGP